MAAATLGSSGCSRASAISSTCGWKRNVIKALNAGAGPEAIAMPQDRFAQASIRIALRQLKASGGSSPALTAWFAAHDSDVADDPAEELAG
jgi:hypothetical protein